MEARITCHSETGLVGKHHTGLLLVIPIIMSFNPSVIFLDNSVVARRMHRTDFRAYKPTWFNGHWMVLVKIYVPVVIAKSLGIWLRAEFLLLYATWDIYQSSWGVMILLWPLACFSIIFPPSQAFSNRKMALFEVAITVAIVVIF